MHLSCPETQDMADLDNNLDMNLELVAAENLRICGHEAQEKPKRDMAGEAR